MKPTTATTYTVRVKVKDKTDKVVNKDFTVNVSPSVLKNTSTISATSITLSTALTITGKATGGTSPYQYAAYYKKSSSSTWTRISAANGSAPYYYNVERMMVGTGTWKTVKSYASVSSVNVSFPSAGTYSVRVTVQDISGEMAVKYFSVKAS